MAQTNTAARKPNAATRKPGQLPSLSDGGYLDIVMIHAVLESLFTIFDTMVKLKIQPGIPEPKQGNTAKGDVSGLIGMNSGEACGSIAVSLTLPSVREISRNLLGYEIGCIDQEAADLTGELTNMLAGNTKRIMSEKGHDFDMQLPQLMLGKGHEIIHHYSGQTVILPINAGHGEFFIELNFV